MSIFGPLRLVIKASHVSPGRRILRTADTPARRSLTSFLRCDMHAWLELEIRRDAKKLLAKSAEPHTRT